MPVIVTRAGIPGVNITSWNTCMAKAYCKWPVIIGIIIASVVILSILWCCARCLCCGLSCCCDCFSCCGMGSGRNRNRGTKYADPPQNFQPAPYQGYQQSPNQDYQQHPNQGYNPAQQQPNYEPPQFAQFDVSKKPVNEDALPAMPSWENATSRKVLEEHDGDMEMGTMGPTQTQRVPMLTTQAPSPPAGYAPASSQALDDSYQQHNTYNGADPGSPHLHARPYGPPSQPQWGPTPHAYSDQPPQPAYSAYSPSPSASTRYAPSSAYEQQETGTVYNSRSPPPLQQQQHAPSILLAGRKPVPNTWQDV